MQATVRGFDPSDGSGSVFFDDGTVACMRVIVAIQ